MERVCVQASVVTACIEASVKTICIERPVLKQYVERERERDNNKILCREGQ